MLKGLLRVADAEQIERLHRAALEVLETTGLRIRGRFLLEALADAGCRVDMEACRAWLNPDVVERQIAAQRGRYRMVRSSLWYPFCKELPADDVAIPDAFACDFGFGAPALYDYPSRSFRSPTAEDQVAMIHLGNGLDCVKAVCAPFICGDRDSRMEILESARLLIRNTRKPGWVGTSSPKEVPYLAELASLVADGDETTLRTQPPIFVNAYCTTSPLKIDARSCDVLERALPYGFPVNFAPMPILGGTAPVTPAGAAVVAGAEILGAITAASLVAPDVFYYATVLAAEMDMKTTQVCFATPASILAESLVHQWFRGRYGIVCNVEPAYVEAKVPGIQAAFLKTYLQMGLGSMASHSFPLGLLDNGAVFSPTQAMLDLEANRAMYGLARGCRLDDEALCVDLINALEFCDRTAYLETDHTLQHFRDTLWDPRFFDRTYRRTDRLDPMEEDARLLDEADAAWREIVEAQEPIELDPKLSAEVDRIVEAARADIMA